MTQTSEEINAKRREHYKHNREKISGQQKKYRADPIAKEKKRLYDLTRENKRRHKKCTGCGCRCGCRRPQSRRR